MDNLIGKKIEHFLIEIFIGKGKTGAVYQARDLNLDRSVAIKFLSPELAIHPGIQQQVAQAARAVSSLTHPSIVTLYDVGNYHGRAYLVMDFVSGMSLDKALKRLDSHQQFMPIQEVLHIMAQAADGLGAAHQAGTRHLNLKPSNVLIKRQHRPSRPDESPLRAMLTDFGLSLIPETGLQTAYIDLRGNFPYLAPEQCTDDVLDGRADIYGLGVILYQLLTGRVPFDVRSATEAIMRHSVEPPVPVRDLRPEVSPAVAHIVHTALAKEPAQRFQLAEQLADALRQASRMMVATQTHSIEQRQPATQPEAARIAAANKAKVAALTMKLASMTLAERPEPATPPQPTRPPVPRKPVYHSPELLLSETMPVQPQFDTPAFGTPANDVQVNLNRQSEAVAPFTEPVIKPTPSAHRRVNPSQPTPAVALPIRGNKMVEEIPTDVHVLDILEEHAQIVIIRQGRGPRRVTLSKPQILIGRAKDNDIVLNARDVSRYHARLDWVNGRWRVTDLDSSGGTFGNGRRLDINEPESWAPEQILQIGAYFFHWAAASDKATESRVNEEPKTELFQITGDTSQLQSSSGRFSVALHPALITMMAGDQTTVQVELFNMGATADTLKLAMSGLPAGTFSLTQHFVTLAPGARANIPLALQLPASGTLMSYRIAAGNHPFELVVHSKTTEGDTAVISGMLIVNTLEQFSLSLWPSHIDDGDNIRILIRNEGNTPNSYSLIGRDEKNLVQFGGQRGRMQLKPGEAITQVVTVRTRQRLLFGRETEIPFEVEVRTENGQQQATTGNVRVQPQIPHWAVWLSAIIFALLLTVLIATAVFSQNQAQLQTPTPINITPASQPLTDAVNVQHTDAP